MRKEDFARVASFFPPNTENKDVYWKNVREKLSAGEVGVAFYNACDEDEMIS